MSQVPDFSKYLEEWSDIHLLRQNRLLNESSLITFARDRGLPIFGVVTGEPGEFHDRGWLASDAKDEGGEPLFHLFRAYVLHQILQALRARGPLSKLTELALQKLADGARDWNRIIDLAILLEPIYWPHIIGSRSIGLGMSDGDHQARLQGYRDKVFTLIRTLDPAFWQEKHERMRIDAGWLDRNAELYLMLRIASWDRRKKLEGQISGALWIRHIAEVIRRAFEKVHSARWLEEDQSFGYWPKGARRRAFGCERPLDDVLRSKPYLAYRFDLFTGSAVRWYVEGETEYYAVIEALPDASRFGIELVNLKGNIASEKNNLALKLEAMLLEDVAVRRFSVISFDCDVPANVKTIRRLAERDAVVGAITKHDPDFELANFAIDELAEVAARIDEANGFPGDPVRLANWAGISGARAFEGRYLQVSARKAGRLKNKEWGKALAAYAMGNPNRSDNGKERPLWRDIRAALHAWNSDYDLQRELFKIDPTTFQQVSRGGTPD